VCSARFFADGTAEISNTKIVEGPPNLYSRLMTTTLMSSVGVANVRMSPLTA